MNSSIYAVTALAIVVLATLGIGALGLRISRTTSDFYVASRTVSPWLNGSAISGEYLSAASFLGVAGLIFIFGPDMLWYPVGYTVGYLVLLALVAAPLRRSGAFTLPDFAEVRLESLVVRRVASVLVLCIGWLYLLPQLQGAGLALRTVTGAPGWVGGLLVALIVMINVSAGGMRSITFVQAFQYWFKLTALAVPVLFLVLAWRAHGAPAVAAGPPVIDRTTTVTVTKAEQVDAPSAVTMVVDGAIDGNRYRGQTVTLQPGVHQIGDGTRLTLAKGAVVPHVTSLPRLSNDDWSKLLPVTVGGPSHALYITYSLMIALFLGTMGLPHVVVRFYTNPDGRTARRTTLVVLGLLSVFYLMPPVYAALGRIYAPDVLLTGQTDALPLVLPGRLISGVPGQMLTALLAGGAFAAFLSTSSGLVVSLAGVLSQDVLRAPGSIRAFRFAAVVAAAIPFGMMLLVPGQSVANVVGMAFAVAASSFSPLLVLGIWWRGLTSVGATAGAIVGGGSALVAGGLALVGGVNSHGMMRYMLDYPAAWTVPLGFGTMIALSLLTPGRRPPGVDRLMTHLHAPESLGLRRVDHG